MPSNYTENYELSQWEKSDQVLMEDFNADNKKIDAAIKAQADALMSEKTARESAVAAERAAREAAVAAAGSALDAAASRLGNCRIERLSVYDDGTATGVTLKFSAKPELFLICSPYLMMACRGGNSGEESSGVSIYLASGTVRVGMCSFRWDGPHATTTKLSPSGGSGTFQIVAFYAEDAK